MKSFFLSAILACSLTYAEDFKTKTLHLLSECEGTLYVMSDYTLYLKVANHDYKIVNLIHQDDCEGCNHLDSQFTEE